MFEISFVVILLGSLIGLTVMMLIKVPLLVELVPVEKELEIFRKINQKIKTHGLVKSFSKELILHRVLSKFRVFTIRTENKTSDLLVNLRQRSIKKKNEGDLNSKFSEDYWKKVKRKK